MREPTPDAERRAERVLQAAAAIVDREVAALAGEFPSIEAVDETQFALVSRSVASAPGDPVSRVAQGLLQSIADALDPTRRARLAERVAQSAFRCEGCQQMVWPQHRFCPTCGRATTTTTTT